ncbi:MAG TPA: hypothetical protein VEW42_02040 [Candidatus Eisenbacteria bacterium]|nr:hypothetical protein [Candidatus Eisenbacteria bacterium]
MPGRRKDDYPVVYRNRTHLHVNVRFHRDDEETLDPKRIRKRLPPILVDRDSKGDPLRVWVHDFSKSTIDEVAEKIGDSPSLFP